MSTPEQPTEKLQKVIARNGITSRRDAERWIIAGRVKVNGQTAQIGARVNETDRIEVDGKRIRVASQDKFKRRVIAYHKPEGQISSRNDPEGRRTVFDNLPRIKGERWISIGRLDYNTTGLMLFTNDGELANTLMHPSAGIDREYMVRVMGNIDNEMLERLRKGVMLEDGLAKFTDIAEARGEEDSINRWFYVCVMEGRNREVRRLWESQEVVVSRLKRVRFGPIFIPAKLRKGQWQELTDREVKDLEKSAEAPS
ncbi:Ribosomal large subunit pseudouridine synthase B [BD1-7 clade bacterium]|uniref:Pseudouridine synthase n=1 Tax=BD1-7 clade bacterium TaxID=2029982 RepID=A0A5S9QQV8_9GAMM|nr:Ribosomal large subunit pseudouridine synthase B [BD1-7 clade bacterium]CAA0120788.1 Ribosomal large subunit pseudouridine synthase B [BD1-7 clade bacterium]